MQPIRQGALVRQSRQSAAAYALASSREQRSRRRALLGGEASELRSVARDDHAPREAISSQSYASVRSVTVTERKSANMNWRMRLTSADKRWDTDRGAGKADFGSDPKSPPPKERQQHTLSSRGRMVSPIEAKPIRPSDPTLDKWGKTDARWS